jgi:hypothetical protein
MSEASVGICSPLHHSQPRVWDSRSRHALAMLARAG